MVHYTFMTSDLHFTNIGSPENVKIFLMLMIETSAIGYNKYLKFLYIFNMSTYWLNCLFFFSGQHLFIFRMVSSGLQRVQTLR